MSTNNLDALSLSPFGALSSEITQHILSFVNPEDVLTTRLVCKQLKDISDN